MWGIVKPCSSNHPHLWLLATICLSQAFSLNTPPHLSFDREWILTENEPVGSFVARIRVGDDDGDRVKISLGAPSSVAFQNREDGHTFFRVDTDNRIILAKSLAGMAGQTFLVGVIATDGNLPNRADAKVTIRRPNEKVRTTPSGLVNSFNPGPPPPLEDFPGYALSDVNGPPLLHLDPFTVWTVADNVSAGTFITRVEATDLSGSSLTFSLHPSDLLRIDRVTGEVTVAQSLDGKVGDHTVIVNVSDKYTYITEKVTLRVTFSDPTSASYSTTTTTTTASLELRPQAKLPSTEDTSLRQDQQSYNATTLKPMITIIDTDAPQDSVPSKGSESTLGWTVILLIVVFGVMPLILAGVFLLWRWQRRKRKKSAAKESSVSFSEKRGSTSSGEGTARNRNSIIDELFSVVKIYKRAESNRYEDFKIPKVPSRRVSTSKSSVKSTVSTTTTEEKDEWEFSRHKLKVLGILGEGCFGQVWKCEARDLKDDGPNLVAVKTLKESAGDEEQKDLMQELKVLKSLGYHPNVVSLLGCCTEKEPIFVILEYMVGGKLQSYLRASRAGCSYDNLHGVSGTLIPRDLTIFALQIAKGMDFLSKHGIIHRDLAARNILIGEDKICKVADFGFARDVANNHIYERKSDGRLPIRWMAPESLFDNIFTTKSDVWSFGILLWEIVTLGSTPYPGMSAQEVMRRVKDGYRLEKPNHCRREIYNIMYYCWDVEPNKRDSFAELVQTLKSLIATEVEYIQLDNFPDHSYYNFSSGAATGELL